MHIFPHPVCLILLEVKFLKLNSHDKIRLFEKICLMILRANSTYWPFVLQLYESHYSDFHGKIVLGKICCRNTVTVFNWLRTVGKNYISALSKQVLLSLNISFLLASNSQDRWWHYILINVQIPHHECHVLLAISLKTYINNGTQSLWEALLDFWMDTTYPFQNQTLACHISWTGHYSHNKEALGGDM